MAFNINAFNASINENNGLLYASHFLVMITAPKWSQGKSNIIKSIPMLCDATELPGVNFQIEEVRPSGYGLFDSRPIFSNFAPLSFTFYCDGNGELLKFFQAWMQNIQNFNVNQRQSNTVNGAGLGVFNYPDWYETTIEIFHYNAAGKQVCKWTLHNAYPLTLQNLGVSWDQADQLLRLHVQFNYRAWTTEGITQGETPGTDSSTYSLSRLDPTVALGINQMFQTSSGMGSLINNVLGRTVYSPLSASPIAQINTDNVNPYQNIITNPVEEVVSNVVSAIANLVTFRGQ